MKRKVAAGARIEGLDRRPGTDLSTLNRTTRVVAVMNAEPIRAAQVEGSVAFGMGAALYQECTVRNGRIVETNFDTYDMVRIDEFPTVETLIVPSGGFWGGVGEPTICVVAPAILNAIRTATGKAQRTLPLKNAKLRDA